MLRASSWLVIVLVAGLCSSQRAQAEKDPAADPARADASFAFQGEYSGDIDTPDGKVTFGVQIIALGDGKFRGVSYPGGLPGDGWDTTRAKTETDGEMDGDSVLFRAGDNKEITARVKNGELVVAHDTDPKIGGTLKKVIRKSSTLEAKPPDGAIVLFDGANADQWKNGKVTEEKLLMQGPTSKRTFGDCTLHIEFMLPYVPKGRGQDRGNSGCYLQGRYEVQILDSFGLEGKNNEAGGIYSISDPSLNMCFPPLSWQTYDIEFTAAKWEGAKKVKNARMTVRHNGVIVQNDVEVPRTTTAAPVPENSDLGPIYLQDHGHAVRFRNIWVVPK